MPRWVVLVAGLPYGTQDGPQFPSLTPHPEMRTMNKLRLQLDDLTVESFDTVAAPREKGTVFGEQCTCDTACTCPGCPTCPDTCQHTCEYTCDDATCGGRTCDGTCYPVCPPSQWETCWRICGPEYPQY